jgi:hypothetical protein
MKKQKLLGMFFIAYMAHVSAALAAEHHSGHSMSGSGGGAETTSSCLKPHVSKFLPAHLATVSPESAFSFVAFNIHKPENISVTVKKLPVPVTYEFKDPYYLIKGKLPASLKNTVARIDIKVTGKSSHCETENGWLVKIADN